MVDSSSAHEDRRRLSAALLIEVPAVVVILVMMAHVAANALLRAFFDSPLPNTLEVTQYWYLPIVAFLGFVAAQARGQHVATDLLYKALPYVTKRYVLALGLLAGSVVSFGFAWFGWQEAVHAYEISQTAGVSDLVAWPSYFLIPLAFGSLSIQFLVAAVTAIAKPEAAGNGPDTVRAGAGSAPSADVSWDDKEDA